MTSRLVSGVFRAVTAVVVFAAVTSARAQPAAPESPSAIATYECLGLYWKTPVAHECTAEFREHGAAAWRRALPLAYDARDGEYRGSIVGLKPATAYEVRLTAGGRTVSLKAHTRPDQFPVGETTYLPAGDTNESFTIKEFGRRAYLKWNDGWAPWETVR